MEGRCLDRSAGVELDYVSTGCSLSPHSCAWSQQGLVAFGSNRSVSLYSADYHSQRTGRVLGTLNGHTARVNCVAWIPSLQRSQQRDGNSRLLELVSGSVDKQLIFWQVRRDFTSDGQQQSIALVSQQMLTMHTDVVVSVHACRHENATLLASSSADCSVRVWRRPHDDAPFECMQKLACGRRGYVLDVSFGILPAGGLPILACACDDFHIHLWACGKGEDGTTDTWRCVQQLVGHEDWVRTVHFAQCPTASDTHKGAGDLLLASGAQDSYVRIWRVSANSKPADLPAGQLAEIRLRENTFTVGESQFSATLDAVLSGHEHWVYGVHWQPAIEEMDGTHHQPLCLVSSSMDKTVIVWRYNAEASVWLDESRMGDIGGNTLGFYGAIFSPCGEQILGHGYQGAFHLWRHDVGARSWWPQVTVSGHFGPVFDITWSQNGCLLSVSKDQTCRLHGEWCRSIDDRSIVTWHELARPQIHGYDLQCIAMTSPFRYACGADEKVVRVFDASTLFLANLSRISGREMHSEVALPLGATVPALGLSNKAVYDGDEATKPKQEDDEEQFGAADVNRLPSFSAREMTSPPVEEDLLQNTLWPETQKLYGHSYELYSLASDGKHWLASACKASKAEFSSILLWNTATWSLAATLRYHNLTVTQLSFSHSGEFLLAVSRDRMWSLWQHDESKSEAPFVLVAGTQKQSAVHQRVIWSCSWSPDDKLFATGSRDKKVVVWSKDPSFLQLETRSSDGGSSSPVPYVDCGAGWGAAASLLELADAATAVQFAPSNQAATGSTDNARSYSLAVGLENGSVLLTSWSVAAQWNILNTVSTDLCPTQTVQRLRWRPLGTGQPAHRREHWQLAVASADHSVRILVFPSSLVDGTS